MRSTIKSLLLIATFAPALAFGHARLNVNGNLPPRNANAGLKVGPCGNVARTATPKVLTAGQALTIQWQETINHPGRYEFYFSPANDVGFTKIFEMVDVQNGGLANGATHDYTATITIPNVPCTACTIQMIQVMTENPAAPSNYYSCADIVIQAAAPVPPVPPVTPPAPTPTPGPTPGPTPSPDPVNCQ